MQAETYQTLQNAYNYFTAVQQEYDFFAGTQQRIGALEQQKAAALAKKQKMITVGRVLITLFIGGLLVEPLALVFGRNMTAWLVAVGAGIAVAYFLLRKASQKAKAGQSNFDGDIADAYQQQEQSIQRLAGHFAGYEQAVGVPCPIAFDYATPSLIYRLMEYVRLGRADSIKEAINLMEMETAQDMRHAEMMRAQREMRQMVEKELNRINTSVILYS